MKLVLFTPGREVGGTALLFARLAAHWQAVTSYVPEIIDFADGITAQYLRERDVEFVLRPHIGGRKQEFAADEILLTSLLPARALGYQLLPEAGTKIVLWLTHPQDAFKWIPTFQVARTWPDNAKSNYARIVHSSYLPRLRETFRTGIARGGLIAMDNATRCAIVDQFDLTQAPEILPIFTDEVEILRARVTEEVIRICWVGRLTDFKLKPVLALIEEVDRLSRAGRKVAFDIIGDGAEFGEVQAFARRLNNPAIALLGSMPPNQMERHLATQVDLFVGHGTAILEAAKLGIPALLIDGFYFSPAANTLRFDWLHEREAGNVGEVINDPTQMTGRTLAIALDELSTVEGIGEACLERWKRCHQPRACTERIAEICASSTLQYRHLDEAGMSNFDLQGALAMRFKRYVTRNKY